MRRLPWAIAFVCMVLGIMLSTQFKVQRQVDLIDVTGLQRAQDLSEQLQKAEKERDALMGELEHTRNQILMMATSQTDFRNLSDQLIQARLHAGLIGLTGPGVVITMNDSTRPVTPGENSNNFIIHDEDVLKVINELYAGGAEALSINGQRLIGRSEIRCTGPTITINGVRTAPPIMITAVGDATKLESAIMMRGGVAEGLKQWGIVISLKKETTVTVPPYKGSLVLEYGTAVKTEVQAP
jgi:uncharacterized protein YlxW (UPF0749 family)